MRLFCDFLATLYPEQTCYNAIVEQMARRTSGGFYFYRARREHR